MFGNGFKSVVDVFGGGDGVVDPNQLLVVEEEADARGAVVRVGNLKAVAHGAVDVAEEGEGEIIFVGEGSLLGDGIHGDSEGADFGGGEFLR